MSCSITSKKNFFFNIRNINLMIVFSLLLLQQSIATHAQTFAWAKQFGGSGAYVSTAFKGIKIDPNGNIYTYISISGTADVDPGPGVVNLATGSYWVKLNPAGNFIWAKNLPGRLEFDASGNMYLFGSFTGTRDFDPGPGIYNLTSFGWDDVFIQKLDNSGNFIWARQVGGAYRELCLDLVVSSQGVLYVTGSFGYGGTISPINSCDFDPDPVTTYSLTNVGGSDGFVLALDLNGQFISVLQKGTTANESVSSIGTDASGNIYYIYNNSGNANYFLEKASGILNITWSVNIGTTAALQLAPIHVDQNGNTLISGGYGGTVDFDPGPGNTTFTGTAGQDPFVEKFDANGNFVWAKVIRANGFANCIVADASGDVYSTGYFNGNGNIDFDPGPGVFNLKASGISMFVQKLTGSGNFVFAHKFGGGSKNTTRGISILVSGSYDIYTTFRFSGTIDVDPGAGNSSMKAKGNEDVVIHKMTQAPPSIITKSSESEKIVTRSLAVYPNPSQGIFYLDLPANAENQTLTIYDFGGSVVLKRELDAATGPRIRIELKKIAGVYLVEVKSKADTFRARIIVQ